jgi:ribosomal protein S18 acetylase RimI-like enzyme
LETLRRAFAQAYYATVAENESGIIGYQLSTGGGQRAHLARLAVHPAGQGKGVGRALLSDLFTYLTYRGIPRLSVNTQSDNRVSLSLYQRMGFVRTGEQYYDKQRRRGHHQFARAPGLDLCSGSNGR